jgi:hypothetical protein
MTLRTTITKGGKTDAPANISYLNKASRFNASHIRCNHIHTH